MTTRRNPARKAAIAMAVALFAAPAQAACDDPAGFPGWLETFRQEAAAEGISTAALAALDGVRFDPKVVQADRAQAVFSQSFLEFSDRMVADYRMSQGR